MRWLQKLRPVLEVLRRRWGRALALLVAVLIVADAIYFVSIWPNWDPIARGAIPKTRFMRAFEAEGATQRRVRWQPRSMASFPSHLVRAFIAAEDARFFSHDGVDYQALRAATRHNVAHGKVVFGASTISQQTVKNLFLTRSRSLLRKWHELVLTWAMERNLSKQRILSIYLNVVELGPGTFGVEAAATLYFGVSAARVTLAQAAELAATLPSPRKHNPTTRTTAFLDRRDRILRYLDDAGVDEQAPPPPAPPEPPPMLGPADPPPPIVADDIDSAGQSRQSSP